MCSVEKIADRGFKTTKEIYYGLTVKDHKTRFKFEI